MPDSRRAAADDLPQLARVLARAFADDPVMTYLVPATKGWEDRAARFFLTAARHRLHQDRRGVWTTQGLEAGAVWAAPGQWKESPLAMLRAMPDVIGFLRSRLFAGLRVLNHMEGNHPRSPDHWYLAILGTDPDEQGKGHGSALMQPMLEHCDAEGVPAYLESSKFSNVAFYARHGFEEREPLVIPGGPTVFPMWREPRP